MTDKKIEKPGRVKRQQPEGRAQSATDGCVVPSGPVSPVVPKKRQLLHLISQPGGMRISQLVEVLGWQAHTVRATLSGLRKRGHVILASKASGTGEATYKLMPGSIRVADSGEAVGASDASDAAATADAGASA